MKSYSISQRELVRLAQELTTSTSVVVPTKHKRAFMAFLQKYTRVEIRSSAADGESCTYRIFGLAPDVKDIEVWVSQLN